MSEAQEVNIGEPGPGTVKLTMTPEEQNNAVREAVVFLETSILMESNYEEHIRQLLMRSQAIFIALAIETGPEHISSFLRQVTIPTIERYAAELAARAAEATKH